MKRMRRLRRRGMSSGRTGRWMTVLRRRMSLPTSSTTMMRAVLPARAAGAGRGRACRPVYPLPHLRWGIRLGGYYHQYGDAECCGYTDRVYLSKSRRACRLRAFIVTALCILQRRSWSIIEDHFLHELVYLLHHTWALLYISAGRHGFTSSFGLFGCDAVR